MSRPLSQKKRPFVLASSVAALLSLTLLLGAQKAAADEYWDGTTTGGSNVTNGQGGSGTWDNATTNWVDATGNNPNVYDPNQTAHFATTGGTITLGDNISFTTLQFDADGYTVDSGGSFTLTPASATGTINAQPGVTVTINPKLTGSGGISFQGGGTILLTNTGNDYAGTTTIGSSGSGPTVVVNSDGELGSSGAAITFDGGTLRTTASLSNTRSIGLNSGGGVLAPDSGTTLTLNGTISGTGTLTVTGSGSVALGNSTNSYSGGTNIVGGTVIVSSDGNLGSSSGPLFFNGGKLVTTGTFPTSRPVVLSGTGGTFAPVIGTIVETEDTITGTGGLTMAGNGVLQFNGTASYTGPTLVQSGILRTVAANAMSNTSALTVNSGATFDLQSLDQTVGSIAGAGTITLGSATLTAGQDNSSTTFSGSIQDSAAHGGLTKVGTGTLTLTGANNYIGATTVNGGTLLINPATNPSVLKSSSNLMVGGGTFQLNGVAATTASQILNGLTVTAGSSEIAVNNLGTTTTLDLRGTSGTLGINHIAGSVDFEAITGTLGVDAIIKTHQQNDATGIIGIWATVNGGSAFAANNGSDVIVAYGGYTDIAARGDVVPNGSGLNVRINSAGTVGPDTLAKSTTNINTLTQNTNTDSIIDLANETLRVGNIGGIVISSTGANLTIGATANSGTLTAGGSVNHAARQLGLSNNSAASLLKINSVIANDGNGVVSVIVGGSGITALAGNNTYTGSTTVSSGTLRTDAANTIPSDSAVLVNTGATLDLNNISAALGSIANGANGGGTISLGTATLTTGGNDTDTNFSGAITGTGGLIKTGTGTLTLSGTSSYSGGTTLNDGRLNVNSASALGLSTSSLAIHGGTLGTTVAGGITIANPVTLLGNFSVATNVDTSSPGNQNLTFGGKVSLGGTTRVVTGVTPGGQVHFGNEISNGSIVLTTNAAVDSDTSTPYVAFIYDGSVANTYTGLTTVTNSAILVFEGSMPANTAVLGNVDVEGNGIVDYLGVSNQIADTSTVTVNSTGSNIGGSSHFDGLELRNFSDTIGTLNGSGSVGLGSGTLTVAIGGNFTGVIEDGAFGTGGNLTLNGASTQTLVLSGKNTYTGATTVSAGTLQAGAVDTLSVASAINITSGGTLDLNGFSQQTGSITGSGAITLGSGTLTTGLKNTSTTFSGAISGTGGLTKSGTGTLTLNGANTYTGNTTVTRGTLTVTPPSTAAPPVLSSASTLVLGGSAANDGGTFRLTGIVGNATSLALNGLIVNAGSNFVIVDNITTGTTTTTLDLGTFITRNSNGFVDFSATNGTLGSDVHIKTTQGNDASGILGAWATVNNGADFATKNASNEIVGLSTIAGGYTNIAATFDTVPNGSNLNVRINSAVPLILTASMNDVIAVHPVTSINTLTQNFTTASTIDLAGGTLKLGSDGGILITPNSASLKIGAAVNDGVLTASSTGGPANITLANNSAAGTLTINSAITDAGGGPVSVRLTGTGLTVFAGSNTYSGSTSILAGTLRTDAANIIPSTSAVTLNAGATLNLNSNSQTIASITDGANGGGNIQFGAATTTTLTTGSDNSNSILSGVISGGGNLVKVGTGTLTLSGNNTYIGNTTLTSGGLTLNSNTALGTGAGTLTIQSGTIGTQKAGGVTISNPVSVQGDFSVFTNVDTANIANQIFNFNGPTFDLNGATRTITGLTNGGRVQFGGAIINGGITFNTSFTKTGDYVKFIYNGTNTYTGTTTVNNGAVLVFQGSTANSGAPGDVDVEGNGVVEYLSGDKAQIADNATVTVNSGGNVIVGQYFGGLDLFNSSAETIGTLNGSANGVVALGAANLTIGAGNFAGAIFDGTHSGISGGQITKVGPGTLILSGGNFYTGGTTINGGILQISSDQNLGSGDGPLTFGGGTLRVSGGGVQSNRLVTLNTTATVDVDRTGALQWDGKIQGTGNLIKTGEGNFFITSNANTFTGTTTVDEGLLGLFGTLLRPVIVNNHSTFLLGKDATLTAPGSTPVTVNDRGTFDNFAHLTSTGPAGTELTSGPSLFRNESNATLTGLVGVKIDNTAGIKTIVNFGTIASTGGAAGTAIDAIDNLGGVTIANFGTITGQIHLGTGVNTIVLATNLPPKSPSPVIPGGAGLHDTLEMAGGGEDTFDLGPAVNFEYLRKVGQGLWNLTGTGNFSAGTTIHDGTINLKGTLNSNVLIESLGALSGTGLVVGKVNNYGTIMPGTRTGAVLANISPGTLTLNGDFAQSHGGAMVIQVNGSGAGEFSRLTIGGHAQLDGSLVVQKGGTLSLKIGQQVTFLTADGGVSGRFSNVTNPFATGTVVIGKLVYGPNSVALEGAQGSFRSIENEFHLTANQKAVAKALDSAAPDARAAKLIGFLDTRPNQQLPIDFDRIAPEEMTSIFRTGVSLADVQGRNVQRRTADLRAGASGFSTSAFQTTGSPNYSGGLAGPSGSDSGNGKTANEAAPDRRWGTFIAGVGDFVHIGDSANARGADLNTGGVTVGADYKLTPELAVGVTVGYTGTNGNLADNGHILVNGGKVGVYGTYYKDHYYVDASLTGGVNNYSTRRSALEGEAFGSTHGNEVSGLVDAGYDWRLDALTIGPTATFQYTYVGVDGFTEHGSLTPLRYAGQHATSIRSTIGLHLAYDLKVRNIIVRPEGSLAWQHEYGDRSYSIDSALASGAGDMFTVSDTPIGRDSLLFSAGVAVLWNPRTSTYLYYDADLLKKEYNSQSVTGGLRMNF